MPENDKQACFCPSCQAPATRQGNKITCEGCDAVYSFSKTGSARVDDLGPVAKLAERVDRLEALVGDNDEPEPEDPNEPKEHFLGD